MAQDITLPSRTSRDMSGYLLAAIGAILFSMKAIFVKLAYGGAGAPEIGAIALLALRMAFAAPVYLAIGVYAWRDRARQGGPLPSARQIVAAMLVGVLGYYGASYLDFLGLVYLTAQFERLILFTYPFFVMLLGALFFAGRITGWGVLSLLLAYAGIAVIFLKGATATGDHVVLGAIFVLGSAFSFALYQLLAKTLIAHMGSRIFTCIAMSSASAAVLLHFAAASGLSGLFDVPARIVGLGVLLAIFSTVLPSFMLNAALGRISAQAVAVLGTLSPSATIIMAIIVLGEPFTAADAAGTVLVMAGVGLFTWRDAQRRDAAARSG